MARATNRGGISMGKKYSMKKEGSLFRIRALRNFGDVKKGDLGGLVENERNLSQFGDCWVYDGGTIEGDAKVYGNAKIKEAIVSGTALVDDCAVVESGALVCGDAIVTQSARVRRGAIVKGRAHVFGRAIVTNESLIFDQARVSGDAKVCDSVIYGEALITDNASIYSGSAIYGNAEIYGNARVADSKVYGFAKVSGKAYVRVKCTIRDCAAVYGTAEVSKSIIFNDAVVKYVTVNNCEIGGNAVVHGDVVMQDAKIHKNSDYMVFKNWWSSGRYFVWTRSNDMWRVGCFCGSGEDLIKKAYNDSEEKGREYERIVKYVEAIKNF